MCLAVRTRVALPRCNVWPVSAHSAYKHGFDGANRSARKTHHDSHKRHLLCRARASGEKQSILFTTKSTFGSVIPRKEHSATVKRPPQRKRLRSLVASQKKLTAKGQVSLNLGLRLYSTTAANFVPHPFPPSRGVEVSSLSPGLRVGHTTRNVCSCCRNILARCSAGVNGFHLRLKFAISDRFNDKSISR